MTMTPRYYPRVDESFARLQRAGWSIGDRGEHADHAKRGVHPNFITPEIACLAEISAAVTNAEPGKNPRRISSDVLFPSIYRLEKP